MPKEDTLLRFDSEFLENHLKIKFKKYDEYSRSNLNNVPFIYFEVICDRLKEGERKCKEKLQNLRQKYPSAYIWIYLPKLRMIIVTRAFGDNKFFIFTENWAITTDYLHRIHEILYSLEYDSFDELFSVNQTYEIFFQKIQTIYLKLISHIKQNNSIGKNEAFMISKKIITRIIFIYFICEKGLIRNDSKKPISSRDLILRVIQNEINSNNFIENGFFLNNLPKIIKDLYNPELTNENEEFQHISSKELNNFDWNELLDFFDKFIWGSNGDFPNFDRIQASDYHGILTPGILGYIYEHSMWEFNDGFNSTNSIVGLKNGNSNKKKRKKENKVKGVYYTPEEIAKYISETSIFQFIRDKFNKKFDFNDSRNFEDIIKEILNDDITNSVIEDNSEKYSYLFNEILMKIRLCDIACGSGAFLTAAFDTISFLFKKCINRLEKINNEHLSNKSTLSTIKDISYFNSINRIESFIITNCIFGIDIQKEAINIVKFLFFLYISDNSDSTEEIISNIKDINKQFVSGNSLIGISTMNRGDINEKSLSTNSLNSILMEKYQSENLNISKTELKKLKPLHYIHTFPDIFITISGKNQTGFDIIIGNPPYIENKKMNEAFINKSVQKVEYISAYKQYDYSILFIERAWHLLKSGGYLSFIITNKFCASDYGIKIRRFMLQNTEIINMLDVSSINIFKKAATYPIIFNFKKIQNKTQGKISGKDGLNNKIMLASINKLFDLSQDKFDRFYVSQNVYRSIPGNILSLSSNLLIAEKIRNSNNVLTLEKLGGNDMKYRLFGFTGYPKILKQVINNPPISKNERYYKFIGTKNLCPFAVDEKITFSSQGYKINQGFLEFKDEYNDFWDFFGKEKLLIKEVSKNLIVSYDPGIYANLTGMYMYIPESNNSSFKISLFFMLGILNSRLIDFIYKVYYKNVHMASEYLNIHKSYLALLPIKNPSSIYLKSIEFTAKILFILVNSNNPLFNEIYELLNHLVYELYFEKEIGNTLAEFIMPHLFEIKDLEYNINSLNKIIKFHKELFSNEKFLRIKEELLKNNKTISTIEKFYK